MTVVMPPRFELLLKWSDLCVVTGISSSDAATVGLGAIQVA